MLVGQGTGRVSTPVNHEGQLETVLHLIGSPALSTLSTPASLDTGVQTVGDPILKSTVHQVKSKTDIPLYNLANTPILYNQLCIELESYPFEGDKLQLLNGFKFGFPLH